MSVIRRKMAVLTSGGDSPGMNACVRAIVRTANYQGWAVLGVKNGFQGLIEAQGSLLSLGSVGNMIQRGGTFLGSSRSEDFRTKKGRDRAYAFLRSQGIYHLITLGGDGTFHGADVFSREYPVKVIGIPCTIDNDLWGTDFSIGYDTAVNTAVQCVDRIRDTADSHGRIFLVEVMGRNTGHIAIETALAAGAEFVVSPEVKFKFAELVKKIQAGIDRGKKGSIVIVAEGSEPGRSLGIAKALGKHFNRDVRATILGHLQRGGSPSAHDRNLASRLGEGAVECVVKGKNRVMLGMIKDKISSMPIKESIRRRRTANLDKLKLINILST